MNNHKIIKIKDNIHIVYKVFSSYESRAYWIKVKDNIANDWRVLKPGEEIDGLAIEEYLLDYIISTDVKKGLRIYLNPFFFYFYKKILYNIYRKK